MKYSLLTFICACLISNSLRAQIFNNDLEDWYVQKIDYPLGFQHAYGKLSKTADAHTGSSAVRLSGTYGGGYLVIGELGADTVGKGLPFAARPDSLIFWIKSSLVASDSCAVAIAFQSAGKKISNQLFLIEKSYSTYQRLAFKINYFNALVPDSIALVFASSSPFRQGSVNSWIQVDDISFSGTSTNIPNPGFENWNSRNYNVPVNWWNPYLDGDLIEGIPALFDKTWDAGTGAQAIVIKNTITPGMENRGQTETGSANQWGWPAFPVGSRVDTLYGLYKWLPDQKDTWGIYIMM